MSLAAGTKLGPYDRRFAWSEVCARRAHRRAARGPALDRAPDPLPALRSRGANLLPPSGRETIRAANDRDSVAAVENVQ